MPNNLKIIAASLLLACNSNPTYAQRQAFNPLIPSDALLISPDEPGPLLRRDSLRGPIRALVTAIIDGDTFEARLRIWFGLEKTVLVRLRGIDAPEVHAHCRAEAIGAQSAKLALRDYLSKTTIILRNISIDKYGGRIVASVFLPDPSDLNAPWEDVNNLMLAAHLARRYTGDRRGTWCTTPQQAHLKK